MFSKVPSFFIQVLETVTVLFLPFESTGRPDELVTMTRLYSTVGISVLTGVRKRQYFEPGGVCYFCIYSVDTVEIVKIVLFV